MTTSASDTTTSIVSHFAAHDEALNPLLQMLQDTDDISTVRTLILKALSHPDLFCGFDEIKTIVNNHNTGLKIKTAPDGEALLRTLDLFSYGTFLQYKANTSSYVSLTDSQVQKLKLLSVVSLVHAACVGSGSKDTIAYETIAAELGLAVDTVDALREVEDIVLTGVYANILRGKLCQKTKTFCLVSVHADGPPCMARDVHVSTAVPSMLATLQRLQWQSSAAIQQMKDEKRVLRESYDKDRKFWAHPSRRGSGEREAAAAWPMKSPSSVHEDLRRKRSRGDASQGSGLGMGRF